MEIIDNTTFKVFNYFILENYNNRMIKCVKITKIQLIKYNKPIIRIIQQLYKKLPYKCYIRYNYNNNLKNHIIIYYGTDKYSLKKYGIPTNTLINNILKKMKF